MDERQVWHILALLGSSRLAVACCIMLLQLLLVLPMLLGCYGRGSCCILLGSALHGAQMGPSSLRDHCDVLRLLRLLRLLVPRSGLGGAIAEWVLQRTLPKSRKKWARNGQEIT